MESIGWVRDYSRSGLDVVVELACSVLRKFSSRCVEGRFPTRLPAFREHAVYRTRAFLAVWGEGPGWMVRIPRTRDWGLR